MINFDAVGNWHINLAGALCYRHSRLSAVGVANAEPSVTYLLIVYHGVVEGAGKPKPLQ